jgi:hypothetical protein
MVPDADHAEQDYASYRLLVGLWAGENTIKTVKFLVLLATQALLLAATVLSGGLVPGTWPLCAAGAAFSLVWILSLGRTVLFQEAWRLKIRDLAVRYPGEERFQALETAGVRGRVPVPARVLGAVPSGYYLLGVPVLLLLAWAIALGIVLF